MAGSYDTTVYNNACWNMKVNTAGVLGSASLSWWSCVSSYVARQLRRKACKGLVLEL